MNAAPAKLGSGERLHALDSLRAFAMFLGVVLHSAIAYQTVAAIPWIQARRNSLPFDVMNFAIHAFRLQLFFLIAGLFAHMMHERMGSIAFLKGRCHRILLPFLLGMATVIPLTGLAYFHGITGSWPYTIHVLKKAIPFNTGHLWFLEYLLLLYVAAVALTWLFRSYRGFESIFARILSSRWKLLLLALPTLAFFSFSDNWGDVGLPVSIIPMPHVLAYYGIFFATGWAIYKHLEVLAAFARNPFPYIAVALVLLPALLGVLPIMHNYNHAHYEWLKLAAMAGYNVFTWGSIFALFGLALRYFNHPSNRSRYFADASYWFYLVHLPIVLTLQALWKDSLLSPYLQFAGVLGLTTAACAVTYHYGVRYTWIGTMLNGKRQPPEKIGLLAATVSR